MKPQYFFICAVLAGIFGVAFALSHQHQANHLAAVITAADQGGQDTAGAQQTLSAYVHHHMGVSETVFLEGSYDRAVQAAQGASNPSSNGQVYADAQAACAGHADSITQANCVQAYVAAHAAPSTNPQAVAQPTKMAFTKKFTGPSWTADTTGVAFLVMLATIAMGFAQALARRQ